MLSRGAVAQLGERRVRNAKVEGSIPFRSTINSRVFWRSLAGCRTPLSLSVPVVMLGSRASNRTAARNGTADDVSGRGFESSLSHLNVILKGWVDEISNDVECVGAGRLQCLFA